MISIVSTGVIIGILVSAPMGPVGILCLQRTLSKGRLHGLATGIGAALSDVIYAALSCLAMGVVVNFIEANQAPLQLFGSIILGFFGYYIYQSNPTKSLRRQGDKKLSYTQDFLTSFLLTFSNVFIVLLYIALFARFGFVLPEHSIWVSLCGIGGIGLGAMLWWIVITYFVSKLRKWFNIRSIWILNRIIGVIILLVSVIGLLSVILAHYLNISLNFIYV
ncbi:MAG: LysE family transporter [Massilibacteroides sp.]|nr:LysE family transporter [Massilibacteroides sp.]MDD3062123.1 LysE family transporter [Massilibacteroides sp.]MDD4114699.1 LysE family transporter [Massilibacteroides sp.]MDD4660316.1 LysE family transporter [Massilibacteroides sp.]